MIEITNEIDDWHARLVAEMGPKMELLLRLTVWVVEVAD